MKVWRSAACCCVIVVACLARGQEGGPTPPASDAILLPELANVFRDCGDRCPGWTASFVVDALFLQRDNAATNRPLSVGSDVSPQPGATLLDTSDLQFPVAPGARLLYGWREDDHLGYEIGYLGVYGWNMEADAGVSGIDQIAVPGAIADVVPGWLSADSVGATYTSALNIVEANVFHSNCCQGCGDCGPYCRCTELLCGLFWAGLEEAASLNVTCCVGDPPSPYRVQTSSNLVGAQLGMRRRQDWKRWSLEGTAKAGLAAGILAQSSGPITSTLAPGEIFREPTSASAGNVGLLSMVNATAIYRITRHWDLRTGYNLIWLDGLALAPNQWDFSNTADSGRSLVGGGSLFLHGVNVGVQRRW